MEDRGLKIEDSDPQFSILYLQVRFDQALAVSAPLVAAKAAS